MGFIYLATNNINNKKYVGQTTTSVETRWTQHKSEARYLRPNVYFVRALKKYGPENFTVETLEECDDSLLDEREQYYIAFYGTYNNRDVGYNSTPGGNSNNRKYEREHILNMWDDGYTINEIAKELSCCTQTVSTVLKSAGIDEYMRRSRSMAALANDRKKAILQYDLEGNLINRFDCIEDASRITGFGLTAIRDVCNHRRFSSCGYIWCHEDEPKTIQEWLAEKPLEKTKHPIMQYSLSGELVKEYDSIIAAAEALQVHRSSIENALQNKAYNCQGFLWKYKDDPTDIMEKVKRNNSKKDYLKRAVNQYTMSGDFVATYDSAASAAIAVGKPGNGSSITKACNGKLKSAYKYKWSYAE